MPSRYHTLIPSLINFDNKKVGNEKNIYNSTIAGCLASIS